MPSIEKGIEILKQEINVHPKGQDDLIEVLHKTQEIFGYIPKEAIALISKEMNVANSIVFGVITFYHFFTMSPPTKHTIKVCLGTACYVKGADKIIDVLKERLNVEIDEATEDGMFKIQGTRCLGACGLAPVIMIDDEVYGRLTPQKTEEIINKYYEKESVNA